MIKDESLIIAPLKKRAEFLYVAQGERAIGRFLSLQSRQIPPDKNASGDINYGITASKKVGNAVMRNRAKRRLRVLLRNNLPQMGRKGFDYVAIARPQTVNADWHELERDVQKLLERLTKTKVQII